MGLRDYGYTYMNLDDCWSLQARDNNGHIQADPSKFPSTIKNLSNSIHSMGLKFGLYATAGTKSCDKGAGSLTYEQQDAQDFAKWNVDYLKYGDCNGMNIPVIKRFKAMANALNSTGRPIFMSVAKNDFTDVSAELSDVSNAWRTSTKVSDKAWEFVRSSFIVNNHYAPLTTPGTLNDPDLLYVGSKYLSAAEERTQFSLWAISKAPLLISADLSKISTFSLSILKSRPLIAVNQDPTSKQAVCVYNCGGDVELYGAA